MLHSMFMSLQVIQRRLEKLGYLYKRYTVNVGNSKQHLPYFRFQSLVYLSVAYSPNEFHLSISKCK